MQARVGLFYFHNLPQGSLEVKDTASPPPPQLFLDLQKLTFNLLLSMLP